MRPDILLIVSDDHRWDDLGACGNADVRTPHLDRLASEGLRLDGHSTPSPMCAPGRMALYTGIYPVRNGGYPNHSHAHAGTRSMVHHLGGLGYRIGLHGKWHIGPRTVFPFEEVADVAGFLARDADTRPRCLVIATAEPHAPWGPLPVGCRSPDTVALPSNLLDTPATRDALARYYGAVARLDTVVGGHLAALETSGRAEDALVIYTSDHGAQFPGGKWTCYQPGLRVPCIARWPGRIHAGTVTTALTQHVDILPTLLAAAGATDNGGVLDGRSALPVLLGQSQVHRSLVYGVQTQLGAIASGPYPVRSVCDGRWKLIRNLGHHATYANVLTAATASVHENHYWPEWVAAAHAGDSRAAALVRRYLHRPPVEIYDLQADPGEFDNRVDDPQMVAIHQRLAEALDAWMRQQGDLGMETELAAPSRRMAS